MPRPVPEVVAVLEAWLAEARSGEVRSVFVLGQGTDGEWDEGFTVKDSDDLILELRTARFRVMRDINTTEREH
jgi:hypothetical protein